MTIEELGSLGELIAAVATVVTLVYLAAQMRQNTKLVASSIAQAQRDSKNELTRVLAESPAAARIFREGLMDIERLTREERYQFDALVSLTINHYEQSFAQGTMLELINDQAWFLAQPGLRTFWAEFGRNSHRPDFCDAFESILDRVPVVEATPVPGEDTR